MTVVLNGSVPEPEEAEAMVRAVQDLAILEEKGGYLLKAAAEAGTLHLEVVPVIVGNERNLHHKMKLGIDAGIIANGFFNVDGSIGCVLLKMTESHMFEPQDIEHVRELIGLLCKTLLDWGMSAETPLDWAFQQSIGETGLMERPAVTLGKLAEALNSR